MTPSRRSGCVAVADNCRATFDDDLRYVTSWSRSAYPPDRTDTVAWPPLNPLRAQSICHACTVRQATGHVQRHGTGTRADDARCCLSPDSINTITHGRFILEIRCIPESEISRYYREHRDIIHSGIQGCLRVLHSNCKVPVQSVRDSVNVISRFCSY